MNGYGECCPVLEVALERQHPSIGLVIGTRINFKTGFTSDALAIKFRKGRKGDASYERTFDDGSSLRGATFGWVEFCPFCGAKDCTRPPTAEAAKEPT